VGPALVARRGVPNRGLPRSWDADTGRSAPAIGGGPAAEVGLLIFCSGSVCCRRGMEPPPWVRWPLSRGISGFAVATAVHGPGGWRDARTRAAFTAAQGQQEV